MTWDLMVVLFSIALCSWRRLSVSLQSWKQISSESSRFVEPDLNSPEEFPGTVGGATFMQMKMLKIWLSRGCCFRLQKKVASASAVDLRPSKT